MGHFDLDMDSGLLTLRFSEAVRCRNEDGNITIFDVSQLSIQGREDSSRDSIALTADSNLVTTSDAAVVEVHIKSTKRKRSLHNDDPDGVRPSPGCPRAAQNSVPHADLPRDDAELQAAPDNGGGESIFLQAAFKPHYGDCRQ